jgi:hypothetical protein
MVGILILTLGGLHVKRAVERGIWVLTRLYNIIENPDGAVKLQAHLNAV